MPDQDRDEAIHPASEIKLARARQHGEYCRSYTLAQAVQVAAGMAVLGIALLPLALALLDWTRDYWTRSAGLQQPETDLPEMLARIGWPLGLLLLALFVIGCASHLLQTGWSWGQRPLLKAPSWQLDQAVRQWFSPTRWIVALAGLGCLGATVAWWWSNGSAELEQLSQLWAAPAEELVSTSISRIRTWLLPVVGSLLLVGGLDYALQRWSYFQRLQMTDQELRDEQKDEQNLARSAIRKRRPSLR